MEHSEMNRTSTDSSDDSFIHKISCENYNFEEIPNIHNEELTDNTHVNAHEFDTNLNNITSEVSHLPSSVENLSYSITVDNGATDNLDSNSEERETHRNDKEKITEVTTGVSMYVQEETSVLQENKVKSSYESTDNNNSDTDVHTGCKPSKQSTFDEMTEIQLNETIERRRQVHNIETGSSEKSIKSYEKTQKSTSKMSDDELLTKAQLLELDEKEPKWKKIRLGCIIGFAAFYVILFVAVIVIIPTAEKCPAIHDLPFWRDKVAYWLNVLAFKDSNGDQVGDLLGLLSKKDYIKNNLGAGYVILDVISKGQFVNKFDKLGLVEDFMEIDTTVGNIDDLKLLVKKFHKSNIEVVLSLDLSGISTESALAKPENLLAVEQADLQNHFSRAGKRVALDVFKNGRHYFNIGDQNMVNLNLQSASVISNVKAAMLKYVELGVDGFLLKNVAFYGPQNFSRSANVTHEDTNIWFSGYPYGLIYTQLSVNVIRQLKLWMNDHKLLTGKPRLLAVDPGNTGYGGQYKKEPALIYSEQGADMIVGRQCIRNRGWKTTPMDVLWKEITLKGYLLEIDEKHELMGMTTGTPSDIGDKSILPLAFVLLSPGSPIIYSGTEIEIPVQDQLIPPAKFYPKNKVLFPSLNSDDTTIPAQIPMPWNRSSLGFSPNSSSLKQDFIDYLQNFKITETVHSATAPNRGDSRFTLAKKLIELRKNTPSLKWGELKHYEKHIMSDNPDLEVFLREAEGFPTIVIALYNPRKKIHNFKGTSLDFSGECQELQVLFAHGTDNKPSMEKKLDKPKIFLPAGENEAVYVFSCTN